MKHTEYIVPIGEEAKTYDEIYIGVIRLNKELIRCKDCRYLKPKKTTTLNSHCVWYNRAVMADDYCSKAERKEDAR